MIIRQVETFSGKKGKGPVTDPGQKNGKFTRRHPSVDDHDGKSKTDELTLTHPPIDI